MRTIKEIIERKKHEIDCSEEESAEIKGWLRQYYNWLVPSVLENTTLEDIKEMFPIEFSEYMDEDENDGEKMIRKQLEKIVSRKEEEKSFKKIPNLHILKVKYVWYKNTEKIQINSERFGQKKIIDYPQEFDNALEGAIDWLTKNDFNIIGKAEGDGYYYLITTTFEPLKRK